MFVSMFQKLLELQEFRYCFPSIIKQESPNFFWLKLCGDVLEKGLIS